MPRAAGAWARVAWVLAMPLQLTPEPCLDSTLQHKSEVLFAVLIILAQ